MCLAKVVKEGLHSILSIVVELGCGKDSPPPYKRGTWGWHVANVWVCHIMESVIVYGPMMAWHYSDGWTFCKAVDGGSTISKQGRDFKTSKQLISVTKLRAT